MKQRGPPIEGGDRSYTERANTTYGTGEAPPPAGGGGACASRGRGGQPPYTPSANAVARIVSAVARSPLARDSANRTASPSTIRPPTVTVAR